jgi:tRNA dimethylallyltransferase
VAVVGPTGSGKTALAVELAVRFGGEIVNTDSLQVYRYLDIGTGKPSAAERLRATHHLLDVVNPDQPFSAGDYVAGAGVVLDRLAGSGRIAILCGGTGLYFRALTEGLAPVPAIPPGIRLTVEEMLRSQGAPACHAELARMDPARAAQLHPNDMARIGRALEVMLATGAPIGRFHDAAGPAGPLGPVLHVGWQWERPDLYAWINRRVEEMLAMGWVEEVRRVLAMGYPPDAKPLRSIGYREIVAHLAGKRDADALAPQIQQRTRNYAKRQLTWFRHQTRVQWFAAGQMDGVFHSIDDFLKQGAHQTQRAP